MGDLPGSFPVSMRVRIKHAEKTRVSLWGQSEILKAVWDVTEYFVHHLLACSICIIKSEGHYFVTVIPCFGHESDFLIIMRTYGDGFIPTMVL
jgi:hypothetical protein